jgi:hypothetical protein
MNRHEIVYHVANAVLEASKEKNFINNKVDKLFFKLGTESNAVQKIYVGISCVFLNDIEDETLTILYIKRKLLDLRENYGISVYNIELIDSDFDNDPSDAKEVNIAKVIREGKINSILQ